MSTSSLDLLSLPREVLSTIFLHLSTPSFLQTSLTCRILFTTAAESRNVLLHHLNNVPGIKLGLSDHALTTLDLFQLLRQRASEHLYGAHFRANCRSLQLRNGTLDARASCLAESTDYFNISLALQQSLAIRHYGCDCVLKEHTPSPYADGKGKVLHVVHNQHLISVLYQWISEVKDDLEIEPVPVPTSFDPDRPGVSLSEEDERGQARPSKQRPALAEPLKPTRYHLVHYNAYSNFGPPDFYTVTAPSSADPGVLPVHLAVHSRLKCVIIWDAHSPTASRQLGDRQVVLYATDKQVGRGQAGTYTSSVIYPLKPPHNYHKIQHETHGDVLTYKKNKEHLAFFTPRATAFHSNGQKIALYSPSSVVPYAVLFTTFPIFHGSSPSRIGAAPRTLNEVQLDTHSFRVDTPFYGSHAFSSSTDESDEHAGECTMVYLQLAHGKIRGQEVLCIMQSRIYVDADDCRHIVALGDFIRQPNARVRIAARLWGWRPTKTTMTALDTVSISPRGTRIAVSCWDKVFIWALNPEVLCERLVRLNDEDGSDSDEDNAGSEADSDAASSILPIPSLEGDGNGGDMGDANSITASSVIGNPIPIPTHPTNYYDLVRDPICLTDLQYHVELNPIVLKLPGGAVARKMTWTGSSTKDVKHEPKADADAELDEAEQTEEADFFGVPVSEPELRSTSEADREHQIESKQSDFTATSEESEPPEKPEIVNKQSPSTIQEASSNVVLASDTEHHQPESLDPCSNDPETWALHQQNVQKGKTIESTALSTDELNRLKAANSDPSLKDDILEHAPQTSSPVPASLPPSDTANTTTPPDENIPNSNTINANLNTKPTPNPNPRKRRKRHTEDELIILTDRGVQLWDLGVWAKGKREKGWLDERLI